MTLAPVLPCGDREVWQTVRGHKSELLYTICTAGHLSVATPDGTMYYICVTIRYDGVDLNSFTGNCQCYDCRRDNRDVALLRLLFLEEIIRYDESRILALWAGRTALTREATRGVHG